MPDSWTQAGHNHAGIFYFRKKIVLPSGSSEQSFILHIGAVDKFDRTFVNGIQVGTTGDIYTDQYWNTPRVYEVPRGIFHDGENVIAVRALSLYSVCTDGGLTGPAREMFLESTDGSVRIPLSGFWQMKEAFDAGTAGMTCMHNFGQGGTNSLHGFFDSMIFPIQGTALSGVLWYQGEANAICSANIYQELLELMIADWRRNFLDSQLHFYILQLAEFQPPHVFAPHGTWPKLREAQMLAAKSTGSTLINTIGTGDAEDIHPRNKKACAELIATYEFERLNGKKTVITEVKSISLKDKSLQLVFNQALDPESFAGGMVVAGKDMTAFEAQVKFTSQNTIEVSADEVAEPFAVWYAWAENPRKFGLKSVCGIPVPPFRKALDHSFPVGKNLID